LLAVILFSPGIPGFNVILLRSIPEKQTVKQNQSAKNYKHIAWWLFLTNITDA
jgi:hypothetical protein